MTIGICISAPQQLLFQPLLWNLIVLARCQVEVVFNQLLDRTADLRDKLGLAGEALSLQAALEGLWQRAEQQLQRQQQQQGRPAGLPQPQRHQPQPPPSAQQQPDQHAAWQPSTQHLSDPESGGPPHQQHDVQQQQQQQQPGRGQAGRPPPASCLPERPASC